MRFRWALLVAVFLAGCAQGADSSGDLPGMSGSGDDGGSGDASLFDGGQGYGSDAASPMDGASDGSPLDGAMDSSAADTGTTDALPPPDTGAPDSGPTDTGGPDTGPDVTSLGACGICDQVWVCNGFADPWVSNGPEECDDTGNSTKLFCVNGNTINYADPNNNDGTWAVTSSGFSMYFNSLNGTVEIDCVP